MSNLEAKERTVQHGIMVLESTLNQWPPSACSKESAHRRTISAALTLNSAILFRHRTEWSFLFQRIWNLSSPDFTTITHDPEHDSESIPFEANMCQHGDCQRSILAKRIKLKILEVKFERILIIMTHGLRTLVMLD